MISARIVHVALLHYYYRGSMPSIFVGFSLANSSSTKKFRLRV
jgi:hypothetical protein